MKPVTWSAILTILLLGIIQRVKCECGDVAAVTGTTHFIIDAGYSVGYKCLEDSYWGSGEYIRVVRCVGNEWEAVGTCVSGTADTSTCNSPDIPSNSELRTTIEWAPETSFAAFTCKPGFTWFSGQHTVISQCVGNAWQPVNDICDTECGFPKHCGDIFELGFTEDELYRIIPSGNIADASKTVRCALSTDETNLGGSWTNIYKMCKTTIASAIQSKSSYINGFGDPELTTYFFIGLQALADLSELLKDEKMILSIEFWGENEVKYHASYSDFSVGPGPNYTLNSIGKYHGNAGDGLCHHVHASWDFGDELVDSANWWGPIDGLEIIKQYHGSFLTQMIWSSLNDGEVNFNCVTMRIRPASFENEKYCPPAIGHEPWWTSTNISVFPSSRTPGTEISFKCIGGIYKAVHTVNSDTVQMSEGTIKCSDTLQWTPEINLPCIVSCPDGYMVSSDETRCIHFSTTTATRIGAIYGCMESGATLATANIVSYMGMVSDTEYRYIAETSRNTGFQSTDLSPITELSTKFTCAATPTEHCIAAHPNQCTAVLTKNTYKHINCTDEMKYICEIPGMCPSDFRSIEGGCYKKLGPLSFMEGLKECNKIHSALAWFTTASVFKSVFSDVTVPRPDKLLIGNNNADGTWTNNGLYPEMDEELSLMMNTANIAPYRSISLNEDKTEFIFFPESDISISSEVLCQFHGPIGCSEPPTTKDLENVYLLLSGKVSWDISESTTYKCYLGYFINGNKDSTEKQVSCNGQLGGWDKVETDICQKIHVCFKSDIKAPAELTPTDDLKDYYLNETITYNCIINMSYDDGTTSTNTSCIHDDATNEYKFSVTEIPQCTVCSEILNYPEEEYNFEISTFATGMVDTSLTVSCKGKHEFAFQQNTQIIKCTTTGWEKSHIKPCYPVCEPAEVFPETSQLLNSSNLEDNKVGDTVTYKCPNNMYITQNGLKKESFSTTCLVDGQWDPPHDSTLTCEEVACSIPPPDAPENGKSSWEANLQLSTVEYTCDPQYSFPNDVTKKVVTCVGSVWEPAKPPDFTCLQYCNKAELPTFSKDSKIIYELPTTTEVQTVVNYTCEEGLYIEPTVAGQDIINHFSVYCSSELTWMTTPTITMDATLKCLALCPDSPTKKDNSNMEWNESLVEGTEVVFTCDTGYTLYNKETAWLVSCRENQWLPIVENIEYDCKKYCWQSPAEPTSDKNFVNTRPPSFEEGTSYDIYCQEDMNIVPTEIGQAITNKVSVKCNSGLNWEPLNFDNLKCDFLCLKDPLSEPENGKINWDKYSRSKNTEISYECDDGYMFGNLETTWNVSCNGDTWTTYDDNFECKKVCAEQLLPEIGGATHESTASVGLLYELVTYTCPEGTLNYITKKNSTIVECSHNGWSKVTDFSCVTACSEDPPKPPFNANYTFTDDIKEGAEVSYFCEGEFENLNTTDLVIKCTDSTWNMTELPVCLNVTIEIPDIDVPADAEFYSQTAFYYQDNIQNFETDSGEPLETVKSVVPLDNAAVFPGNDCAFENNFYPENEVCAHQPNMCAEDGFSFSIWGRIDDNTDPEKKRYLVSTGGDVDGSPGISIYQMGDYLYSVVSTGDYYWLVEAFHHTPKGEWTVVSFRWKEDIGLDMYMLNRTDGTMVRLAQRQIPTKTAAKLANLDPTMLFFGCHATGSNPTHRDFFTGALDGFALWREVVDDMKWFPGGYRVASRNLGEIIKVLDQVPKTAEYNALIASETITAQKQAKLEKELEAESSTSTAEIISSSSEVEIPTPVDTEDHSQTIFILNGLTKLEDCPKDMLKASDIDGYHKSMQLFNNLLSKSDINKETWKELYKKDPNNDVMTLAMNSLDFLECVLHRVPVTDGEPIEKTLMTENVLVISSKAQLSELQAKGKNYKLVVPPRDLKLDDAWSDVARIAVSPNIFNDQRCNNRSISITVQEFNSIPNLHDLVVNEVDLGANDRLEMDSVIIAARVKVDPEYFKDGTIDSSRPNCAVGNQVGHFLELEIPHEVKTPAVPRRRSTLFFDEPVESEIVERYCGQLDQRLGKVGVWIIDSCRMVDSRQDKTRCVCKQDGATAIIARKKDLIHIEEEREWLTFSKYILYGISIVLLAIYILIVSISGDLKDQFHLAGLNLAVAVICGSIGMVASDFDFIRKEQDSCGAIGSIIFYSYLSVGTWIIAMGHSCFKAITAGVINGKLHSYFFMAWGSSLAALGLVYVFFLHDIGTDPRCFVAWENDVKATLLGPQAIFGCLAIFISLIVLCNLSTPALRKDNLIDDYGSFCRGAAILMLAFGATWICGFFAYMRLEIGGPDFYPIFTILNASMGIIIFICIGLFSNRFRTYITGQANARREMLRKQAFKFPGRKRAIKHVPHTNARHGNH